jgi:hypothetical protein
VARLACPSEATGAGATPTFARAVGEWAPRSVWPMSGSTPAPLAEIPHNFSYFLRIESGGTYGGGEILPCCRRLSYEQPEN